MKKLKNTSIKLENKPKDDTKNDSEEIKDTSEKDDVNVQDNLLKKENEKSIRFREQ